MMTLEDNLQKLSRLAMIRLLRQIHGIYQDIDEIIEVYVENAIDRPKGDDGVNASLKKRLQQIARTDEFIDYNASFSFARRLDSLLTDINTLQREPDPAKALDLMDQFLLLVEPVMNRVDDSSGSVGDVFREAVDQWLDIATEVRAKQPEHINWVEKLRYYFDHNDYGCLDNIIAHSGKLLSEHELRQVARDFEQQARQALNAQTRAGHAYNHAASHACIGLGSVATALGNMKLYEQATLLTSPNPNPLQMARLAEFAFGIRDYARVEHWLAQPGWEEPRYQYQHRELKRRLLTAQGKTGELKLTLKDDFEQTPCLNTLDPYWENASAAERPAIAAHVEKLAAQWPAQGQRPAEIVDLLLHVENARAAGNYLVTHPASADGLYYGHLTPWAEQFEQAQQTLAAIICYRALLADILDRGYTKAYRHAARYFRKLLKLDKLISDYRGLDNAQAFIQQLQQQHWRKRSFWAAADYPNRQV